MLGQGVAATGLLIGIAQALGREAGEEARTDEHHFTCSGIDLVVRLRLQSHERHRLQR